MTSPVHNSIRATSQDRLVGILDQLARTPLLLIVTAIDRILTPIQRRIGIDKMGYFLSCPIC